MSTPQGQETYTKPQPVLLAMTITTVLATIFGGLTLVSGLGGNPTVAIIAGLGTLITGAVNQGLAFFTRNQTVPLADVAAFLNEAKQLVSGPAAVLPDGVEVQQPLAEPTGIPGDDLP